MELPRLQPLYEKYRDQGFGILSISLDLAPDPDNPQEGQMKQPSWKTSKLPHSGHCPARFLGAL